MNAIEYIAFDQVNPDDFILLLNNQKVRTHLMSHALFDRNTVNTWVQSKLEVDATDGCKVRAIMCNNQLAGWCGIQCEDDKYEIAIVIDDKFWGLGKSVFYEMMRWATAMGHEEIFIYFLDTRPKYKFLRKIATKVYESELFGSKFTTYQLAVKSIVRTVY